MWWLLIAAIDKEFTKRSEPYGEPNADGTPGTAVNFDAFLTIVLQQYKDKDTMVALARL